MVFLQCACSENILGGGGGGGGGARFPAATAVCTATPNQPPVDARRRDLIATPCGAALDAARLWGRKTTRRWCPTSWRSGQSWTSASTRRATGTSRTATSSRRLGRRSSTPGDGCNAMILAKLFSCFGTRLVLAVFLSVAMSFCFALSRRRPFVRVIFVFMYVFYRSNGDTISRKTCVVLVVQAENGDVCN